MGGRARPERPEPVALAERDRELTAVGSAVAAVRARRGRMVVVSGAAGLGKSALLAHAADRARADDVPVLAARGRSRERCAPFELVRRLVAPLVAEADVHRRDELLGGVAAPAGALFPGATLTGHQGRPDGDPIGGVDHGQALVHALRVVLVRGADPAARPTRRPGGLVLLVDDVHWADAGSLRVLAALADGISEIPISLVVAGRPGATDVGGDATDQLCTGGSTRRLTLGPLSTSAVADLVEHGWPGIPAAVRGELAAVCARAGGGNPFLLGEVLSDVTADLDAGGHAPRDRSRSWERVLDAARRSSPDAVLDDLVARLDTLPTTTRRVATALAVLGENCGAAEAAELTGLSLSQIDHAVDTLVAARLLAGPTRWNADDDGVGRFVHDRVTTAALAPLDGADLEAAHRRAASIRRASGTSPPVVADHLLRCSPAHDPVAASWVAEAVRLVGARGCPQAVRALVERGLAEHPPSEVTAELAVERALADAATGAPGATSSLERALELGPPGQQRAALYLALARVLFTTKRFRDAGDMMTRAGAELRPSESANPDRPRSALAWDLLSDELAMAALCPAFRVSSATRLPGLVGDADDSTSAASEVPGGMLAQYAVQLAALGADRDQIRDLAVRGLDRDTGCRDVLVGFGGLGIEGDYFYDLRTGMAVMALLAVDELDPATTAIEAVMRRAKDRASVVGLGFAHHWRSLLRLRRGQLAGAVADAERTLGVCRIGWDVCRNSVAPILVAAHLERGQVAAAARALAQCAPLDSDPDPVITQPGLVLEAQGLVAAARGRWADAYHAFCEAGARELAESGLDPAPTIVPWRSRAAEAAHALGREQEAGSLAHTELEIARRIGAPRALGVALRVAGTVDAGADGRELLAESVAVLGPTGLALEHSRALIAQGRALVIAPPGSAERGHGRDALHQGLEIAERVGAEGLAAGAARTLRGAGGRRPTTAPAGTSSTMTPPSLTRSERHIAELAADHLSTPAIARTLFMSPKTVEWHLTNAYRKLGVRSRADLLPALNTADRSAG